MAEARNMLTSCQFFRDKVDAAWNACDIEWSGVLNKEGLYFGIIFLHLKLAENAGAAACRPPSRETSDNFFEAADVNHSDAIDREMFRTVAVILCAQLPKRMIVDYLLVVAVVPRVGFGAVGRRDQSVSNLPAGTIAKTVAGRVANGVVFTRVVPAVWNEIDATAKRRILREAATRAKGE